ncbi:MAG: hypothetical protein JW904_10815 [Spirochaetales bacterium]|nr:hypothetical protein [Spirochaetales bacterium]
MKKIFFIILAVVFTAAGAALCFINYIPYGIMLIVLGVLSLRFVDWKEMQKPQEKKVFDKDRLDEILELMKKQ